MAFTYFFRDAQTLEVMIERALPTLCGQAFIHIWDAGCANGSEPFTLAMILREKMSDYVFRNVRIHATDIDPQFAANVSGGIFAEQEVKRIPYPIRYRYFQVTDQRDQVQVVDEIRAKVTFTQHDLLSLAPPRDDFSLVVCKNVLLHFDEAERRGVFRMFHRAMRQGGLLATEHTQKLPESANSLFEPICSHAQIFRRLDAVDGVRSHVDGPHTAIPDFRRAATPARAARVSTAPPRFEQ
jgi:chemotaxis protein methyltransferase CheR